MAATVSDEVLLTGEAFNGVIRAASDRIDRDRPIFWDEIVPTVEAAEEELRAKFTGGAYAADIITDDGEAIVHEGGAVTIPAGSIPNLKHGRHFSQEMIERLSRIEAGNATRSDRDQFFNWRARAADDLVFGIKQRRAYLKACMMTDTIVYNRLGIQIIGTWGMPAAYKVNEVVGWDTHGSATPVTTILTTKQTVESDSGTVLDGMILSRAAFNHMVQAAEFIARIAGLVQYSVPTGAYSPQDPKMETFALGILGLKEIRIDDAQYKVREKNGVESRHRYVPVPRVCLYSTIAKGNSLYWDFGNAITTESRMLARRGEGVVQSGPHGFSTIPADLSPPHETLWAVQRGFPRKHDDYCSAVINTGTYTS
jgi:hypothetical protein